MEEDVYFHKTVTFRAGRQTLPFRTSQELFSSHDVDIGTRFLLRSIIESDYQPEKILDLGCGYGPIGLTLKKIYPDSLVHMVDRDALAVSYSLQNAELNSLRGAEIYGSLGYDDVSRDDFDLVVSNIPGKAGEAVITYLLQEARYYLAPRGTVAIVIIVALAPTVEKSLQDTPGCEITLRQNRSGHAIFHYRFTETLLKPGNTAFERGVYHRQSLAIRRENLAYQIQTAYGLPEFDSPGHGSEMLIDALKKTAGKTIKRAVVFNPGQGHAAVAMWKLTKPQYIDLVDRDLLALRYSRLNLVANGCPGENIQVFHQVGAGLESGGVDLFTGVLGEVGKEANIITLNQATEALSPGGMIIVSGGSTAVTRLVDYVKSAAGLRVIKRERRHGFSLLALQRKSSGGN
jgi:16S rRNA (guanine1207-N2)-methyltransferase